MMKWSVFLLLVSLCVCVLVFVHVRFGDCQLLDAEVIKKNYSRSSRFKMHSMMKCRVSIPCVCAVCTLLCPTSLPY